MENEENNIVPETPEETGPRIPYKPNPFLTRGCCQTPRPYQKSNEIYRHRCSKFDVFDWIGDIPMPESHPLFDVVEIRFKNCRKDFFRILPEMDLEVGDIVAVESSPGHDIGIVTMTGELVRFQMKKRNINPASQDIRKVYRRARLTDIEKWVMAVESEQETMFKSREIAGDLGLQMKINDVEVQGDHTKAIFYYTADDRVDFRELIKVLAEEFKVRIEMRQIGARQEASRLGGIGTCGRELCCSTWLSTFHSVTTNTARIQQLSLNPQKLAGQCGKLKCCLNYEYDAYAEALREFPSPEVTLRTRKGEALHQKTDVFKRIVWYSYAGNPSSLMAVPLEKVLKIIDNNKQGILPEQLEDFAEAQEKEKSFSDIISEEDLTRFDNL